ncbi:strawberry notch-like NTP hydrolase domain-containing protein [Novosphingobium sp. JCM 18896]|uniref:strawberry notch-like NTP hydrolase domain-containing protein n=1 Tax=Novosphingobium sp. JCM 18896 TaxID=2989731 RepID=UPI0022238A0A|nr:strawberry notch family protein [Novosphingobium sp. JCM 18896]MCW1431977.1 strawberry notch family protein [Novosphingobium sp. JCM 18896]
MTDLLTYTSSAQNAAIDRIAGHIASGTINRKVLNLEAETLFGGTNANGCWTQRDTFELLEQGLTRHALGLPRVTCAQDIHALSDLVAALPTQTVRSEDQIRYQQFSTPLDIAGLVVLLAQVRATDIVLEPSAGHGSLVAMLPEVKDLHLNELDPKRRDALKLLFPGATITGHDAALLAATLAPDFAPTLILMNPPFSRSEGRGVDQFAAVRHLRSALSRLAQGGRLVAVMPDWFTSSASMGQSYEATFTGCSVIGSYRLDKCYQKQGTSVAVRIYVVDKKPGLGRSTIVARDSVAQLLEAVTIVPRCSASPVRPATATAVARPSLFKAMRATKKTVPAAIPAPKRNDVLPVRFTALQVPRPLGEQAGVYLPYRPSRIDFHEAGQHPTDLVESVAMGSIPAPVPNYEPRLHERIVTEKRLSEAQLETIVYAGSAWTQFLPGRFVPDKEGVGLIPSEDGREYRKGYFLGDGTGAGKGRQVAGCILDNWVNGRKRNIWVSKNEALLEDARRDWQALGGMSADVQPLSAWKIDEPITLAQGILFVTFPTLRSQRQDASRLRQILEWAGENYEGVIAFDESHEMGGVAGGEGALGKTAGSQQGIAGVLLQNHLPGARVLYASATGASDVNNLAYAVRLGLWGPGTSFANRETFITEIRAGGIAAMELVSRDLKALGLYQARALSFAGVEYDILKHELRPDQIGIYDAYADAWAVIHRNLEEALAITGVVDDIGGGTLNSGAKAAARSRFESCKQRFFNQVLLSMKLPTVIDAIDSHIAGGQSVVVQLVTTAESILNRRLDGLSPEERARLEVDLSPREYIMEYLERAFPTQQMQTFTDDTGKEYSRPMFTEAGQPVHNQVALRAKQDLMERICVMPPIKTALDALLEHYGTESVAEVTGRSKRLVSLSDGRQRLESRSARTNQSEAAMFMAGEKRILVFSDAGGTGRSYHASLDAKNQQRRVHILLEPGWRADRAIQGLGRTHRTHQATTPLFRPCTTDCKGELRFTSTIARRLDSLGALTRGQRQTGGQNLFDPADNLESEYARAALVTWFGLLHTGKLQSTTLLDFESRSGLKITTDDGCIVEDLPPITRWLNRILALPIGMQNAIFEEFLGLVEARVAAAREAGTLDVGVETIAADKARVVGDVVLRTDARTGATSHLLSIEIERAVRPTTLERILAIAERTDKPQFMLNTKSGRVAFAERARSLMEDSGELIQRVILTRPTRHEYKIAADLAESAWETTDTDTFARLWAAEVEEAAAKTEVDTIHLATGLLLPIWNSLPHDYIAVRRVVDGEGNSWLGRLVDESDVAGVLAKFGVASEFQASPKAIMTALAQKGSAVVDRPCPMTIRKSLVNGEQRIELVGELYSQLAWLKSLGCFTEIIQFKTRIFVPVAQADAILASILKEG